MRDILRWVLHWLTAGALVETIKIDVAITHAPLTTVAISHALVTTIAISHAPVTTITIAHDTRD